MHQEMSENFLLTKSWSQCTSGDSCNLFYKHKVVRLDQILPQGKCCSKKKKKIDSWDELDLVYYRGFKSSFI